MSQNALPPGDHRKPGSQSAAGRRADAEGWRIAAVVCSLFAGALTAFIFVQCRDSNEFTFMIVALPILLVMALVPLSVTLWVVTWVKFLKLQ